MVLKGILLVIESKNLWRNIDKRSAKIFYLKTNYFYHKIANLKVQSWKSQKHWQMIAYVFRKYAENFAVQLFVILK